MFMFYFLNFHTSDIDDNKLLWNIIGKLYNYDVNYKNNINNDENISYLRRHSIINKYY